LTYQQLFAVLSRRDDDTMARFVDARNLKDDIYQLLVQSKSAQASEYAILRLFWRLWIFLASLAALIHLNSHLVHGFGQMSYCGDSHGPVAGFIHVRG
jgi:hypothetical protein